MSLLFKTLLERLIERADSLDQSGAWPQSQLQWMGEAGVFGWFHSVRSGGQGESPERILDGYISLAQACLTSTFVLTQRAAAAERIERSSNEDLKSQLLPSLISGDSFVTVGISHFTTSRRFLAEPVMRVEQSGDGFLLDGFCPWVTGASHADTLVTGGSLSTGEQLLFAIDMKSEGIEVETPMQLVALTSSHTGVVRFRNVFVRSDRVLFGPVPSVMQTAAGGHSGGWQTSAVALGLARAAIRFILEESEKRSELIPIANAFQFECDQIRNDIVLRLNGGASISSEEVRSRANSLVLRATQGALIAAKGAGFVQNHPAGRWCREALFFLVWSCPPQIGYGQLCDWTGIAAP